MTAVARPEEPITQKLLQPNVQYMSGSMKNKRNLDSKSRPIPGISQLLKSDSSKVKNLESNLIATREVPKKLV